MSVLFINACVRECSRTLVLARNVLKDIRGEITEVNLEKEGLMPLGRELLLERERLVGEGRLDDEMFRYARQFADADEIVIAAPFWDLAFPALLKIYLEIITVSGITFKYDGGRPSGLCKARRLTYVTTSGGPIFEDFGYSYVRSLAKNFYGIKETKAIRATNLDMDMISAEELLARAEITTLE